MGWKHFFAYWTCVFIGFVMGLFWAGRRRDDWHEEPFPEEVRPSLEVEHLDHDNAVLPRGKVEASPPPRTATGA